MFSLVDKRAGFSNPEVVGSNPGSVNFLYIFLHIFLPFLFSFFFKYIEIFLGFLVFPELSPLVK